MSDVQQVGNDTDMKNTRTYKKGKVLKVIFVIVLGCALRVDTFLIIIYVLFSVTYDILN